MNEFKLKKKESRLSEVHIVTNWLYCQQQTDSHHLDCRLSGHCSGGNITAALQGW